MKGQPQETRQVTTDPRSADYDPVALVQALKLKPRDLYDAEPVDPKWAGQMTERIRKWTSEVVAKVPGASVRELSCRTSSCKLVLFAPTVDAIGEVNRALYRTNQSNMMGVVGIDKVEGGYERPFYMLFSAYREIEAHRKRYDR